MTEKKILITTVTATLAIMLVLSMTSIPIQPAYSTGKPQSASGGGENALPDGTPTHFGFAATKHGGKVSGHFECLIALSGGKVMDVKGTVAGLTVATDGSSATLTGSATVTGFGAGTGTFTAVVTPGGAGVGTITLTTDVDGSGIEGDAVGEGPFNETVVKGSIKVSP